MRYGRGARSSSNTARRSGVLLAAAEPDRDRHDAVLAVLSINGARVDGPGATRNLDDLAPVHPLHHSGAGGLLRDRSHRRRSLPTTGDHPSPVHAAQCRVSGRAAREIPRVCGVHRAARPANGRAGLLPDRARSPAAALANRFRTWLEDLGMLIVGLIAYGAVFAWAGARGSKRPLVLGLVFAFRLGARRAACFRAISSV